jgi:hypothetical protein
VFLPPQSSSSLFNSSQFLGKNGAKPKKPYFQYKFKKSYGGTVPMSGAKEWTLDPLAFYE